MKQIFIIAIFIGVAEGSYSQLYMPGNIAAAYKKGTRAMDGKPGKNYWQNHANYTIDLTVMPPDSIVRGIEKITYFNESPDTIKAPFFRLFLNVHKPGAPREWVVSSLFLNDGVAIDSFAVNGVPQQWKDDPFQFTWTTQTLPSPLLPKDSIHFTIKWHNRISKVSGREGEIDSTTWFLAYFYPRLAVKDDYENWDGINFTLGKEFYNDFNNYSVAVTVPKNYMVWGTGTLQRPETVLQPEIVGRYQQSLTSDAVVNIATQADIRGRKVTAQNAVNRWIFTSAYVPDVAFCVSDHFVWDGCSTTVDEATNRRASAQAAYNDTAEDFHRMAAYAQHSLDWLSHHWPGIPYPYEKTTVVQGFAGMEYPMMANDETYDDTLTSRFVAEHEIAHTYMPFYMGTNESRYGFMDEGWATVFEYLIGTADVGKQKADALFKEFRVDGWINDNSAARDIPIVTPADYLTSYAYGDNEYVKPALGYLAMKDLLGEELFKKCLEAYMQRWNGKHPIPWDFFYTFNDVSGKDLSWFWSNWFFSNHYIDLGIRSVSKKGKNCTVTVDNVGGMATPFNLLVTYAGNTNDTLHQTPAVWEKNQRTAVISIPAKKPVQSIRIDGEIFMDADYTNNQWTEK